MIIGRLETVGFKGSPRFEIWIDIKGCGRMGMVVINEYNVNLEQSNNHNNKAFFCMSNGCLVFGSRIFEFLFEILYLEEHCFGFIVYM